MYITAEELKSVLYEYQITEITEDDEAITDEAIAAAEAEVRSYFEAANARRETAGLNAQQYASWVMYDVNAIFETESPRNAFLKRLIMRLAAFNLCELAQVDVLNDRLMAMHDSTISTLEKIAGTGDYKNARIIVSGLPTITPAPSPGESADKPFRMTSRKKFTHNF